MRPYLDFNLTHRPDTKVTKEMIPAESATTLLSKEETDGRASCTVNAPSIEEAKLMVERLAKSEAWKKIDSLEEDMEAHPDSFTELTTNHIFTPGLYVREVLMKKGDFITTRIHLTEHPFVISHGHVLVWTGDLGVVELGAPFTGITKPGTRRLIYMLEDTIWSTCHANPDNETDPEKIIEKITYNNRMLRLKTGGLK